MSNQLEELQRQQKEIQEQIDRIKKEERATVIRSLQETMAKYDIRPEDLRIRRRAGRKMEPKYQDPVSGKTWSGQGRKPGWLEEGLNQGKSIEDFLINR